MANDKDFILKNAVEVGGPTKVTLGTITSSDIDLSTGNYFKDTPSGTSTYTISNAGDVQSFQLEVTGGTAEVAQNFSTTLYTGNGSTQTITNGIDLDGEGGLVWLKNRSVADPHRLYDTVRGISDGYLDTASTSNGAPDADELTAFNSDGFSLGDDGQTNGSGELMVSWTFKKEPSFFDVVTYTGDGTQDRQISHNLGSAPGCVIVKRTDSTGNWPVWHRKGDFNPSEHRHGFLNSTGDFNNYDRFNNATDQSTYFTDSIFTVRNHSDVNTSGGTYVAYLFAHDTADDSLIKCGSYTGNGSTSGPTVTLGWEPQWLLIKNSSSSQNWILIDNMRGFTDNSNRRIKPNLSNAEDAAGDGVYPTSTGFAFNGTQPFLNENGSTFIYIAIRAASDPAITWPSSIEWAGGLAPAAPAVGETDLFTISTDDGGTTYTGVKTADNLS